MSRRDGEYGRTYLDRHEGEGILGEPDESRVGEKRNHIKIE